MENVMLLVIGIVAAVIGVVNIRGILAQSIPITGEMCGRRTSPYTEKRWARGRCSSALR